MNFLYLLTNLIISFIFASVLNTLLIRLSLKTKLGLLSYKFKIRKKQTKRTIKFIR